MTSLNPTKIQLKTFTLLGLIGMTSPVPFAALAEILNFSRDSVYGYISTLISLVLLLLFFTGYFINQKKWSAIKILLLCSIISCVMHIIHDCATIYFIARSYQETHFTGAFGLAVDMIIYLKWMFFYFALIQYENIAKSIKWLTLTAIIVEIVSYFFAAISGAIDVLVLLDVCFGISVILTLALLITMFVTQVKGTFIRGLEDKQETG